MKICTACKRSLPVSSFYRNKRQKDGFSRRCKECDDKSNKKLRTEKKKQYNAYRKRWKDELIQKILHWKEEQGCFFCDETCAYCLELHHKNSKVKEKHPSHLRTSWERFMQEAKKCVVVCSNCHKKIHAGLLSFGSIDGDAPAS